jgi:hypothetical protein
MAAGVALDVLRHAVEALRLEYSAAGRGEEFDEYVERLRREGHWPFDDGSGPGGDGAGSGGDGDGTGGG